MKKPSKNAALFLRYLKAKGIFYRFFENAIKHPCSDAHKTEISDVIDLIETNSITHEYSNIVDSMFWWDETQEGADYWDVIYNELTYVDSEKELLMLIDEIASERKKQQL